MENGLQYGPYSPQEVDRVTIWLKQSNLKFALIRNDQEAKEALMNDGQNLVNLADLRTGIYLAQVFYVNLFEPTDAQRKQFEELFTPKDEVDPRPSRRSARGENPLVGDLVDDRARTEADERALHESSRKNHLKKRGWATFLSLLLILQVVIAFYFILIRGA